jgi:hypothetical protein
MELGLSQESSERLAAPARNSAPADFARALATPGACELVSLYAAIGFAPARKRVLELVRAKAGDARS